MLASALLLEALGYCIPDPPSVWPPDGASVPAWVEVTVTDVAASLAVRAGGEAVPLVEVARLGSQRVLRPARALPLGPAELVGGPVRVRWTVAASGSRPRWTAAPSVREVAGVGLICPTGPFVTLEVPLADDAGLPLLEVTARSLDGEWSRRYALDDGRVVLHDGCGPPFVASAGSTVGLRLVGVGADGTRTEGRVLAVPIVDTPPDPDPRPIRAAP